MIIILQNIAITLLGYHPSNCSTIGSSSGITQLTQAHRIQTHQQLFKFQEEPEEEPEEVKKTKKTPEM